MQKSKSFVYFEKNEQGNFMGAFAGADLKLASQENWKLWVVSSEVRISLQTVAVH